MAGRRCGGSGFGRGALCGELKDPATLEEKDLRRTHPRFSADNWPRNLALIERFKALAASAGLTSAQLALAWVLAHGDHVHAIPGTTSIAHLRQNFVGLAKPVAPEILDRAGAMINQQSVSGHRYPEVMRGRIETEDFG